MSSNSAEDEYLSPKSLEEVESPRKRLRLDNSARKSWSLMDKKPDHEVFQEMGVGLLEPDDDVGDVTTHKSLKRKHDKDIENVNPNVNLGSPRAKCSPRSPRAKQSPSPGPSRVRSPRSTDKYKPLSELSELSMEHIAEETPAAQSVSAGYRPEGTGYNSDSRNNTPQKFQEEHYQLSSSSPSFSMLSDEVMLSVLRWLPKRTLTTCMTVCKRWYRVASDETLWQRLDLGNKVLTPNALGKILNRKPIILRLANTEIAQWHPTTFTQSRVQFLDLSMASVNTRTLNSLLERCPTLKKLSLESVSLADSTCICISKCKNIETLNLAMASGVTAEGLDAVLKGCTNLSSLNISWCQLSDPALEILCNNLPPRLQRLNIAGARTIKDELIQVLVSRSPRLLELDLSDCSQLTQGSVAAVLTLNRLEHLAVSRCYLLAPLALTKLSSMSSLQYLEVWGMLQAGSLAALRSALPGIQINQFMFSAIARPTVGTRRTSIWGLRTRD